MTINTHDDERSNRGTGRKRFVFACSACFALIVAAMATIRAQIPTDSWPTYHGDYTGRRYSTQKQINATNVKGLALAWVYRVNTSRAGAIVGGEGPDTPPGGGVSGPSPPTTAPARDVLRRYTHASARLFTLTALICLSVL